MNFLSRTKSWLGVIALASSMLTGLALDKGAPVIRGIEVDGTNLVVKVEVPAGIQRVTLEGRPRLEKGAWTPRAVARPGNPSSGGLIQIRLELTETLELLRVRADESEALPASWYQGTNKFSGMVAGDGGTPSVPPAVSDSATPGLTSGKQASGGRAVVESDIWQVSGEKVYFFNQYRGLQVIDLSRTDNPVLEGTLPLTMAGEQMYTLGDGNVVLLARDNCQGYSVESQGLVLVVGTQGGMRIEAAVPVDGSFVESRMVGSALYVASQRYRVAGSISGIEPKIDASTVWEWGTELVSIDLADPKQPKRRSSSWVPGWQSVIHATDRLMLLSNQDPAANYRSVIRVVDISNPDGTMTQLATLKPGGSVADKFKMNVSGDVVTVVSERWENGFTTPDRVAGRWVTKVENFSLRDPKQPVKLGELDLGLGERLFATRFDGNRLYAVTFLRIDPLWVVDLSNPARPTIFGELEIPGWSTYIHPMGDRLVSVGVETNRVAVSLFDVANPAKPGLLSRIRLGENYSWSEANQDEKAFSVFENEGLVMLPYQGQTTNGYASRVQLIDLGRDNLTQRGVIEQTFQPRRTALKDGRVLSISGESLLVVDASNRDIPVVKARLELAWAADRVFKSGNHLISIDNGAYSPDSGGPRVRISTPENPDRATIGLKLAGDAGNVLGAEMKGNKLYVLQGNATRVNWEQNAKGEYLPTSTNQASLTLSLVDLENRQAPKLSGRTTVEFAEESYWGELQPSWLSNGVLIWTDNSSSYYGPWMLTDALPGLAKPGAGIRGLPYYFGGSGKVVAFGFDGEGQPRHLSNTKISGSGSWWNFSKPLVSGTLVYLSHQASEFLPGVLPPGQLPPKPTVFKDGETGEIITNTPPFGTWVQKYFLSVADFSDPTSPVLRKPVNLPGILKGISHQGEVLYTVAPHWDSQTFQTDWKEWLDASSYDGVKVALIDSMKLPDSWPHAAEVHQGRVLISEPAEKDQPARLTTWRLGTTGRFEKRSEAKLEQGAGSLFTGPDWILATQDGNRVEIFKLGSDDQLLKLGNGSPSSCAWLDLSKASGSPAEGFWVPLGIYGIGSIYIKP